jgi:hypothetical protein
MAAAIETEVPPDGGFGNPEIGVVNPSHGGQDVGGSSERKMERERERERVPEDDLLPFRKVKFDMESVA